MNSKRDVRAGLVPARTFSKCGGVAAAVMLAAAPLPSWAATPAVAAGGAQSAAPFASGSGITDFYRARNGRPLWLAPEAGSAAEQMLALISSAATDGLNPDRYLPRNLPRAMQAARRGDIRAINHAEAMLSQAFVAYARDLRKPPSIGIVYVDRELVPATPTARTLLESAARAPSLSGFVAGMGWMNPAYAELRQALAGGQASPDQRGLLAVNLERARALPADQPRYVVVNTAAQSLTVVENGRVVDTMRVVVGKPKYPTPMMHALVRAAALNPYWNVPPDLAAERIAPNVVKQGVGYLKSMGYELLSDWSDHPTVIDPAEVDWQAVADGRVEVRVRQLPGPHNALGKMKFVFPNAQGIFLHDTPERQLLTEASRLYSGGCIRLEDAPRLGRWMFGRDLKKDGNAPEQMVPIPSVVPLYVTYMTAVPAGGSITYFDDVYGSDKARLAQLGGSAAVAGR